MLGNGGDWFELVVTVDHLDIRGWQLWISDDTGSPDQTLVTLLFSNDTLWSDLRSGTLITVSEQLADDDSFDPDAGDWWINVQASDGSSSPYITSQDFEVSNRNWQLMIRDELGDDVFGPAGEGRPARQRHRSRRGVQARAGPPRRTSPRWPTTTTAARAPSARRTCLPPERCSRTSRTLRCDQGCSHLDSACGFGSCNSATGQCEIEPINEGAVCDDASACTLGDVCTAGLCAGCSRRLLGAG